MSKFLDPKDVLLKTPLKEGDRVADFGAGSGHFSYQAAKIVGEDGEVLAFDVLPEAVSAIESQAKVFSLNNIFSEHKNLAVEGGSGLQDQSVDFVILKDVLYQNEDYSAILKEAGRVLKKKGVLLVVDWDPQGEDTIGPPKEQRLEGEQVKKDVKDSGFSKLEDIECGDFHWGFVARN